MNIEVTCNHIVIKMAQILRTMVIMNDIGFQGITQNRRRFERRKVDLPAYIGDPRWQRHDFESITILDISMGGIRFVVPKRMKLKIWKDNDSDPDKLIVIFRIPNFFWPIKVQISPKRVFEFPGETQIAATMVKPGFPARSILQKYLM